MAFRFELISVRKSSGVNHHDGIHDDEAAALKQLDDLADDPDCLLAEIQQWPPTSYASNVRPEDFKDSLAPLFGQAERKNGHWVRVEGDLRCRTKGPEAEAILRGARQNNGS